MEILTTGTVAKDDTRLLYFVKALKVRGIELEPVALQAFAEKKDRGETEAQIIQNAAEWTQVMKSKDLMKRVLEGTALGALTVPVADWLTQGRPSWGEIAKRSPKTLALGALGGAGAAWAINTLRNQAEADGLKRGWNDFKHNTHEMEMAWTEALSRGAAREASEKERASTR